MAEARVKALANLFQRPRVNSQHRAVGEHKGCEIFAPVPDASLNGCETVRKATTLTFNTQKINIIYLDNT